MDMTVITNHAAMLLTVIALLVALTNIVVEVLKKLTWNKIPTDLLAIIVAVALTMLAFFASIRRLRAFRVTLSAFMVIRPQRGQAKCPSCCFSVNCSMIALLRSSFIASSLLHGRFNTADCFFQRTDRILQVGNGLVRFLVPFTALQVLRHIISVFFFLLL